MDADEVVRDVCALEEEVRRNCQEFKLLQAWITMERLHARVADTLHALDALLEEEQQKEGEEQGNGQPEGGARKAGAEPNVTDSETEQPLPASSAQQGDDKDQEEPRAENSADGDETNQPSAEPTKEPTALETAKQKLLALKKQVEEDQELVDLRFIVGRVFHTQKDLSTDHGWTVQSDRDNIRVLYRKEPDSAFHTLRMEGLVEAPIFDNLAIFYEVDLHTTWMPTYRMLGIKSSERVAQHSLSDMLLRMTVSLPWPFLPREIWMRVVGVDCLDEDVVQIACGRSSNLKRQVVVILESCTEYPGYEIPPVEDDERRGVVRMHITRSSIVLTPNDVNKEHEDGSGTTGTYVQLVLSIDPSLKVVPSWFVNFASRHISHYLLALLRKEVLKVKGSIYEERIQRNREFYGFLERRVAELKESQGSTAAAENPSPTSAPDEGQQQEQQGEKEQSLEHQPGQESTETTAQEEAQTGTASDPAPEPSVTQASAAEPSAESAGADSEVPANEAGIAADQLPNSEPESQTEFSSA